MLLPACYGEHVNFSVLRLIYRRSSQTEAVVSAEYESDMDRECTCVCAHITTQLYALRIRQAVRTTLYLKYAIRKITIYVYVSMYDFKMHRSSKIKENVWNLAILYALSLKYVVNIEKKKSQKLLLIAFKKNKLWTLIMPLYLIKVNF